MTRRTAFGLAATLFCAGPAWGSEGVRDWFAEHGRGSLEYRLYWYSRGRAHDERKRHSEYRAELELDIPLTEHFRLFLVPEFRWDSHHHTAGAFDELNRDELRRPAFHFKEAYLEWQDGPWQVRAGEQIFAWGTADGYNPTDNLNPRDYLELVDNEEIPVPALNLSYQVGPLSSLQFVVAPVFIPSRSAAQDSRWCLFPAQPVLDFESYRPADTASNVRSAGFKAT
jgi:hypothetical protein